MSGNQFRLMVPSGGDMTRVKAVVECVIEVYFEDDEELDLKDQAHTYATNCVNQSYGDVVLMDVIVRTVEGGNDDGSDTAGV
jgi:hypothetical protein